MKAITKELILILTAVVLFSYGCKKCGHCTMKQTTYINPPLAGYPQETITEFDACGEELEEADGMITNTTYKQGNLTITVHTTITCR